MIEKTKPSSEEESIDEKRNQWFELLIHHINTDRDFLEMGIASEETKGFYNNAIFGNPTNFVFEMREKSTQYFISNLVMDYIKELKTLNINPLKLYLDHTDSQVLVWAEIQEDDEETEMALYKAEAKANAKNYQYGFHISSTILEDADHIEAPPHYQNILKSIQLG
ncbi:hypothetical protein [Cytophaga aurantiaca]|uniref:hypothetical protein n=1 Tax=Cytophaga aurantiaca TaxID=29530 RepID=UPI00037D48D4|nr:hypothetical protein [Cytophaga aurantiaca]